MISGPNADRATIRERATQPTNPGGVPRGGFVDAFALWCSWRYVVGRAGVEAALLEDQADFEIRINDSARNRTITTANRLTLRGEDYAIVSVGPPDRTRGEILLRVTRKIGG